MRMTRRLSIWFLLRGRELVLAGGLLTRLPMPQIAMGVKTTMADAIWAYPLYGAMIGGISCLAYWLGEAAGLPHIFSVLMALMASVLVSGGLHEDGLADYADSLGGGNSKENRLAIMSDSRIGTYGVLALLFSLAFRSVGLDSLPGSNIPMALIAIHMASRGVLGLIFLLLPPAKGSGLSASHGRPAARAVYASLLLTGLGLWALLGWALAIMLMLGSLAVLALISWHARQTIGGHTGDAFGAAEQVLEISLLLLLMTFS